MKNQLELQTLSLQTLNGDEETSINGGWTDPYNTMHRNHPFLAGIADFFDGIAKGFEKGAESGSRVQ